MFKNKFMSGQSQKFWGVGLLLLTTMIFSGCGVSKTTDQYQPNTGAIWQAKNAATAVVGDNLPTDNSAWSLYSNEKYGLSMRYPTSWQKTTSASDDFLSVRVSNMACSQQCPPEFTGLELRVGVKKNTIGDFLPWIEKQIAANNESGVLPGGKVSGVSIGGRNGIKVEKSDWVGANPGPGYYIGLDKNYYVYILTGKNNLTARASSAIQAILASVRLGANSLPRYAIKVPGQTATDAVLSEPELRYVNNDFGFRFYYYSKCKPRDYTEEVPLQVELELGMCADNYNDRIMGVRLVTADVLTAVNNMLIGRNVGWVRKGGIILDRTAMTATVAASGDNAAERWVFLDDYGKTYIFYLLNDKPPYSEMLDSLVNSFEFVE